MAFVKKTWTDRMSQYPTRRVLTDTTTGTTQTVTVARSEGEVSQTGDAFSASNMNDLENRIEAGINAAHSDADVLLPLTVGWVGKNQAYSQTNNAVIASIESGKSYKVAWTGSATITLKKDSSSGAEVTSGDTSPLSFTADADYDLYFGSSASVTNIMVYDASIADAAYEPYHDTVDECKLDITSLAPVEKTSTASQAYAVDDYFVKDGKLCKVTLAITAGGALTKNTNYVETLISSELGSGSGSGNISYGTSNPSGGNDGDIYFQLNREPTVLPTSWRYMKFEIDAVRGTARTQFSGLRFYNKSGAVMTYPSFTYTCNVGNARGDQTPYQLLTGGKFCSDVNTRPVIIVYDFATNLDLATYNYYRWSTAPDAAERDPITWKLYFSNDRENFTLFDSVENYPVTTERSTIAYEKKLLLDPPSVVNVWVNTNGTWRSDYFPTLDNVVSNIEVTNTATFDYAVGEYLFKQGTLYRVTSAITAGSAFVVNTNIVPVNIMDELTASIIVGTIPISRGGTGNTAGYIRTGQKANTTIGTQATAEGYQTTASGDYSHAEGYSSKATGANSHAEGSGTTASASYSHAEGSGSTASHNCAHAEGMGTTASGQAAHSEGQTNTASGLASHVEGMSNTASARSSHAQGEGCNASAQYASAAGNHTTAGYESQFIVGKYNNNKSTSLFEVGNGTGTLAKSNALELDGSGNLKTAGTITDGNGNVLGGSSGNKVFTWDSQYTDASTSSFAVTLSEMPSFSIGDILVLKIHANLTYSGNSSWGFLITVGSSTEGWSGITERVSSASGYDVANFTDNLTRGTCLTFICTAVSNNVPTLLLISKEGGGAMEQTVTLSTSADTTVTFTRGDITTDSCIEVGTSVWGIVPSDVTVTTGVCTVTIPKTDSAQSIIVRIYVR